MRRAILSIAAVGLVGGAAACGASEVSDPPDAGGPNPPGAPDLMTEPRLELDLGTLNFLFGETVSHPAKITLINQGTAALRITFIDFRGANVDSSFEELDFAPPAPALPMTLPPDAGSNTYDLHLLVSPTSATNRKQWAVLFKSNDPQEPERGVAIVAKTVMGPPCELEISPKPLDFGTLAPPDQRDASINVKNVGTYRCVIRDVHLAPNAPEEFSLPTPIPRADLGVGDTVEIPVRVTAGQTTGTISTEVRFDTANQLGFFVKIPVTATVEAP